MERRSSFDSSSFSSAPSSLLPSLLTVVALLVTRAVCMSPSLRVPGAKTGQSETEYCQSEVFKKSCRSNQRIVINRAEYGRMRYGRCIDALTPGDASSLPYGIGCWSNVLAVADAMCSGERSCEIRVPNLEMDATKPCHKDLKTYLDIDFTCVTVAIGDSHLCTGSHRQIHLVAEEGYLSSDVTQTTNCGTTQVPWIIEALPGQRINVSILDFTFWSNGSSSGGSSSSRAESSAVVGGGGSCVPLGFVVERNAALNQTICGGREREQPLYLSQTNAVEIHIIREKERRNADPKFIVHYKTVGCPDLNRPASAWYKREGDTVVIGCEETDKTWHLVCVNNRWTGVVGNCSAVKGIPSSLPIRGHFAMSNGVSIAVVMGIAILIAVVILIIGVVCVATMRRQNSKRHLVSHQSKVIGGAAGAQDAYKSTYHRVIRVDPSTATAAAGHSDGGSDRGAVVVVDDEEAGSQTTATDAGNEYTHIWETPLPEPIGGGVAASAGGSQSTPALDGGYSSTPRQLRPQRDTKRPRSDSTEDDGGGVTGGHVTASKSTEMLGGDVIDAAGGPTISISRYFLLERRSVV